MKILLFGSGGQLGSAFRALLPGEWETAAFDYPEVDLADPDSIRQRILSVRPDLVINAAAYTDVDRAESEPELAAAVNAHAPGMIGETAAGIGAAVLHYSTDYVFNGRKGSPYVETDEPDPLNVYGRTKLEGERALAAASPASITLRTSWVHAPGGNAFPQKVLRWARTQKVLRVVDDQIAGPTPADELARASIAVLEQAQDDPSAFFSEHSGIYHLAGEPLVSRFEWANHILENAPLQEEQVCREIIPVPSTAFPTAAERPLFSGLNCSLVKETFNLPVLHW